MTPEPDTYAQTVQKGSLIAIAVVVALGALLAVVALLIGLFG